MNATPADLAAAIETVRRLAPKYAGREDFDLDEAEEFDDYTDACELIARHVAANANYGPPCGGGSGRRIG